MSFSQAVKNPVIQFHGFTAKGFLILCLLLLFKSALSVAQPKLNGELIFNEVPNYPSCHASFIIELPNHDLFVAWYAGSREGANDVAILASRRSLGSSSWTAPEVITDVKEHSEGNPVLFCYPDGRLGMWYPVKYGDSWAECDIKYQESKDNGKTWSSVEVFRKEWGWFDRNHLLTLKNGDYLFPLYDEQHWASVFMYSVDKGKTWQPTANLSGDPGNIQPCVIQREDGSLYSMMRTGGKTGETRFLWRAVSNDNGRTWSKPELTDMKNPNAAAEIVRLTNGHVVLAFNDSQWRRTPLSLALSMDEGKTWTFKRNLETADGEFSYPSIIQASDGLIHISYTYRRTQIKHVEVNEEWIKEGGK